MKVLLLFSDMFSEPPVDPKNIPAGDWLCRRCRADKVPVSVSAVFQPLVETAITSNPLIFNLPYELQRKDILPGIVECAVVCPLWSAEGILEVKVPVHMWAF